MKVECFPINTSDKHYLFLDHYGNMMLFQIVLYFFTSHIVAQLFSWLLFTQYGRWVLCSHLWVNAEWCSSEHRRVQNGLKEHSFCDSPIPLFLCLLASYLEFFGIWEELPPSHTQRLNPLSFWNCDFFFNLPCFCFYNSLKFLS